MKEQSVLRGDGLRVTEQRERAKTSDLVRQNTRRAIKARDAPTETKKPASYANPLACSTTKLDHFQTTYPL